jgi:uncharacterized protein (TIGR00251 family)
VSISGNEVKISLRVYPNASRNEVVGFTNGILRVKVSAPPIKGKANRELITFLSRLLGVGKGSVNIIKGHTTRNKVVAVDGLSQEEVMKQLSP